MGTKEKEQKTLNGIQSAVLLLLIVAAVAVCIRFKVGGPMIGLFFSWLIIYVFCIVLKIDYEHVKEGAFDALAGWHAGKFLPVVRYDFYRDKVNDSSLNNYDRILLVPPHLHVSPEKHYDKTDSGNYISP